MIKSKIFVCGQSLWVSRNIRKFEGEIRVRRFNQWMWSGVSLGDRVIFKEKRGTSLSKSSWSVSRPEQRFLKTLGDADAHQAGKGYKSICTLCLSTVSWKYCCKKDRGTDSHTKGLYSVPDDLQHDLGPEPGQVSFYSLGSRVCNSIYPELKWTRDRVLSRLAGEKC